MNNFPSYVNGGDYSDPYQGYGNQNPYYGNQYATPNDQITLPTTKSQARSGVKWGIIALMVVTFIIAVIAVVLGSIAFARTNDDSCSCSTPDCSSCNNAYRYSSVTNMALASTGVISGPTSVSFKPDTMVVLTGATVMLDTAVVTLPSNPTQGDTMALVNYSNIDITVQGDGTNASILDFDQMNTVTLPAQGSISLTISKNNGTGTPYWFIPS